MDPLLFYDQVHGAADLWTKVLGSLRLTDLLTATSTSRSHRILLRAARAHIKVLHLSLVPGVGGETGNKAVPTIVCQEGSCDTASPNLWDDAVDGSDIAVSKHKHQLLRLCACYPNLTRLQINLSPHVPSEEDWDEREEDGTTEYEFGVERLVDVVSWFAFSAVPLKSDRRLGPMPLRLLETPQVSTLVLYAEQDPDDFPGNVCPETADHEVATETYHRFGPLFLMCAVSCQRTLTCLNLSGTGPLVLPTLLKIELPQLASLLLGDSNPETRDGASFGMRYDPGAVGAIGSAFPSLTALDVGYAAFRNGVTAADVERLVSSARGLRHLDLSQVMTYVDFGPTLHVLAKRAAHLRSLATHGLVLPQPGLLALARGCPQLERVHFVAWQVSGSSDDMLAFLRACPHLLHVDLAFGVVHSVAVLTWLEERQSQGRPVRSLDLRECHIDNGNSEALDDSARNSPGEYAKRKAFKARALAITADLRCFIGCNAATVNFAFTLAYRDDHDDSNTRPGCPQDGPSMPRSRMFSVIDWSAA